MSNKNQHNLALCHVSIMECNFFDSYAGVRDAELSVDARVDGMAGLDPRRPSAREPRPASPCAEPGPDASRRSVPVPPCGFRHLPVARDLTPYVDWPPGNEPDLSRIEALPQEWIAIGRNLERRIADLVWLVRDRDGHP